MTNGTLIVAAPPAKFETLSVGSSVQMADLRQEYDSFEGVVLEVIPEWGTHKLPAIQVLQQDADRPTLCIQDGRWQVTVAADAAKVRETFGIQTPRNIITVTPKVAEHVAVQYVGGAAQSAELVRWAVGRALLSYSPGDGTNTFDQLELRDAGGITPVHVSDWLLESPTGFLVVRSEDFADNWVEGGK